MILKLPLNQLTKTILVLSIKTTETKHEVNYIKIRLKTSASVPTSCVLFGTLGVISDTMRVVMHIL